MLNPCVTLQSINLMFALSILLTSSVQGAVPLETDRTAIQEFVHRVYIEGVPYEEVTRLSPEVAVPLLVGMLDNPQEEEYWANIVVILGMLGDDRAVAPIFDFIKRGESRPQLSRSQCVAKTSAVMSLGYIVNRTANPEALAYLKEGVYPETWEARNLLWASSFFRSQAEQNNQLAIMAVLGLGVSGKPQAATVLQMLRQPPATPKMKALKSRIPEIDNIAEEALKANAMISKSGLKLYYEKTPPRPIR